MDLRNIRVMPVPSIKRPSKKRARPSGTEKPLAGLRNISTYQQGFETEEKVCRVLKNLDHEILGRNIKISGIQLDILSRPKGSHLRWLIEVKSTPSFNVITPTSPSLILIVLETVSPIV